MSGLGIDENIYESDAYGFRQLKVSSVWKDILKVLENKKELLTAAIAQEKDVMDIKSLVGQLKELYFLIDLPDMILEEMNEYEEAKKEQMNNG